MFDFRGSKWVINRYKYVVTTIDVHNQTSLSIKHTTYLLHCWNRIKFNI